MTRAEIVQRLAGDLGLEAGAVPPWAHKIAALLEDDIVYLDALREQAPRGAPWHGEIVALTVKRVVRVTIADPADGAGTRVTTGAEGPCAACELKARTSTGPTSATALRRRLDCD